MEFLEALIERVDGLPPALALLAIALATFVSEDLTAIAAALIAAGGSLHPVATLGAAGLGIWIGDLGLYGLGALAGRPLVRRAPIAWFIDAKRLDRARDWFEHRGTGVLWLARFVPGTRLVTYVAAGTLHAPFARFAWITFLACLLWTPLLGAAAYFLGLRAIELAESYRQFALPILGGAVLALIFAAKLIVPLFTWRGRRSLVGRWLRLTRWEFWPPWAFYPPIVAYVLFLGLKHRSLTLFTAVNPAMPAGGFIGESKAAILAGLGEHPGRVARARLLPGASSVAERLELVRSLQHELGCEYPIVLKPDAGQRGSGVKVARNALDVEQWLDAISVDGLVQECAVGVEFGVFYVRYPGDQRGRVFSITHKVFPEVVGDGLHTLEDLIYADPRAVAMAEVYLSRNRERLWSVPAVGERVAIADIGNHCQGAIFLDGMGFLTPQIESAIDSLSRGYRGFDFGRYDVRARSVADFQAGEFMVIELNGATSEATHIYDPRISIFEAWAVLREQWRILFEIARRNRAAGAPLTGVGELCREILRYRRMSRGHPG